MAPAPGGGLAARTGLAWLGRVLVAGTLGFAVNYVVLLGRSGDARLCLLIVPLLGMCAAGVVGLRALRGGAVGRAALLWAATLASYGVYASLLAPALGMNGAAMILGSLALAMPHVDVKVAQRLPFIAGAAAVALLIQRSLVADRGLVPDAIVNRFGVVALPVVVFGCAIAVGHAVHLVNEIHALRVLAEAEATRHRAEMESAQDLVSRAETSRAAAETVAQLRSSFLANMSHEIRTPMNAVVGAASLLGRSGLDPHQRELVETITATSDHLLSIINDILELSKLEAGKMTLICEPFEVFSCVEQATDLVAQLANQKGLDLAYSIDDAVPSFILSDVGRLRQILVNLLGNAIKFTAAGEVFLHIGIAGAPDARGYVELVFSVRDTGIGLTPEEQARLFQAFTQANNKTAATFGGTGLGLIVSKRLAEALGGTMWVESVKGQGSTFRFSIHALPTEPTAPRTDGAALRDASVVVVDDSRAQLELMRRLLADWGMNITTATTAAEALKAVEVSAPSVILLGRRLRSESGVPIVAMLKGDPRFEDVPIVFAGSEPLTDELASQFAGIVRKPIKRAALLDTMMQVVAGRRRATTGGRDADPTLGIHHPLSILLAEDNPVNRRIGLFMLEALGYTAESAVDGMEAYRKIVAGTYDLVLMDLQMPELDGAEASARVRAEMSATERPRIVGLTAAVLDDERARVAETMDGFLAKPVTLAALLGTLRAVKPLPRSIAAREAAAEAAYRAAVEKLGAGPHAAATRALAADLERETAALVRGDQESDASVIADVALTLRTCADSLGATGLSRALHAVQVRSKKGSLRALRSDLQMVRRELAAFCAKALPAEAG